MCKVHPDKPLDVFCNTCNIVICAMCGILHHKSHTLKPVEEVSRKHRDAITAKVAAAIIIRDEVVAAKADWEDARDQVLRNGKAAKEKVNLGFRRVMAEGRQRRDALIAKVDEAVRLKCKNGWTRHKKQN